MIDYTLGADETIVCATSEFAVKRLKTICKYSTCLRLVTKSQSICTYFIVAKEKLGELRRASNIGERENLIPQMFEEIVDETIYRRRKTKVKSIQQKLF